MQLHDRRLIALNIKLSSVIKHKVSDVLEGNVEHSTYKGYLLVYTNAIVTMSQFSIAYNEAYNILQWWYEVDITNGHYNTGVYRQFVSSRAMANVAIFSRRQMFNPLYVIANWLIFDCDDDFSTFATIRELHAICQMTNLQI